MTKRRVYWLGWLLLAFSLYFFENNSGTRIVLTASILVPLLSAVCAAVCAARIRLALSVPEKLVCGQTARCECVTAGAFLSAGCLICLKLRVSNCLTGESSLTALEADGRASTGFTLSAPHCGHLTLTFEEAVCSDWFGLWRVPVTNRTQAELTVCPDLYPVQIIAPSAPSASSGDLYEQQMRRAADPTAYGDIREYVPGDPVRRIHWKLSEKTDRLLIREDALSNETRVRLVFSPGGKDPERISETAGDFLSACLALCAEGYPYEACWPGTADKGSFSAEVGSEREFLSLQEAVLCIPSAELPDDNAVRVEDLPGGRILIFDAAADRCCCTREEPVLEL